MQVVSGIADTIVGSGVATAPAAGATIATIAAASLPKGVYALEVHAQVSNAVAADLNNMELQIAGVDFVSPLPSGATGVDAKTVVARVTLTGSQALDVKAIAIGTAAIEYGATILATRIA